jgi:exosortase E/protease (VPEID-CTERM system)
VRFLQCCSRFSSLEVRWGVIALALTAEGLFCGIVFGEPELPLQTGFDAFFFRLLGKLALVGVGFIAVLLLILSRRFHAIVAEMRLRQDYRWQLWLACHVFAFAGFLILTWPVFGPSSTVPKVSTSWLIGWLAVAGITVIFLMFAAARPSQWFRLLRREWATLLVSAIAGILVWLVGTLTQKTWQLLPEITLRSTQWLLSVFYPDIAYYPPTILSTDSFAIDIDGPCSGYEGIALMTVFGAIYLWLFRAALRFPRALLLIPVGIVAVSIANILRITALFAIGSSVSSDIAVHAFHSYAGWISFSLIALGLITLVHRSCLSLASEPARVQDPGPALALLVPLLTLLATSMLVAAFPDATVGLYPLGVIATSLALWRFRRYYTRWDGKLSWQAILIGIIVFVLWVMLEPPDNENGKIIAATLANMPAWLAAVWLAFRIIGFLVMVPVAEELAFRGYLIRKLVAKDFVNVTPGSFTWLSFLVSSLVFGLLHDSWVAGTVAGGGFAIALYRRGQIVDAIVAHMTTNALIALTVLVFGRWSLWG